MSENVIGYLKTIIEKVESGEWEVELVNTEFKRKLEIEYYEGKEYQTPGEVDDTQWLDTFHIKKPDKRVLS